MGNTDVSAKSQQQIHQHCKRREEQMSAFHCWRSISKDTLEPDHSRISFDNLTQSRSFLGSEFSVASYNPCLIGVQQAFPFQHYIFFFALSVLYAIMYMYNALFIL